MTALIASLSLTACTHHGGVNHAQSTSPSASRTALAAGTSHAAAATTSPGRGTATAPVRASSPAPPSVRAACRGDASAARSVAVYAALVAAQRGPKPRHLYVQTTTQVEPDAAAHPMAAAVLRCLVAGLPGQPTVTLVSGFSDRRIPTDHRTPMPKITGGGWLVIFGPAPAASSGITSITVSRGGNDTFGAAYPVRVHGSAVSVGTPSRSWIS